MATKYHNGSTPPPNSRHVKFPGFQPRYHSERSLAAARKYYDLATEKGIPVAQLALAWCKSRFYICSTIIGATTLEQLKENIAAFDIDLDEDTLEKIDAIHLEQRNPNVTD